MFSKKITNYLLSMHVKVGEAVFSVNSYDIRYKLKFSPSFITINVAESCCNL